MSKALKKGFAEYIVLKLTLEREKQGFRGCRRKAKHQIWGWIYRNYFKTKGATIVTV